MAAGDLGKIDLIDLWTWAELTPSELMLMFTADKSELCLGQLFDWRVC